MGIIQSPKACMYAEQLFYFTIHCILMTKFIHGIIKEQIHSSVSKHLRVNVNYALAVLSFSWSETC